MQNLYLDIYKVIFESKIFTLEGKTLYIYMYIYGTIYYVLYLYLRTCAETSGPPEWPSSGTQSTAWPTPSVVRARSASRATRCPRTGCRPSRRPARARFATAQTRSCSWRSTKCCARQFSIKTHKIIDTHISNRTQ